MYGRTEIVKLLLSDSRVDFRKIVNKDMKNNLLKEESNKLKNNLTASYLAIQKSSPVTNVDGKVKSSIPKTLIKRTSYYSSYEEICSIIKGDIPPFKLIALANILNIEYDNVSWKELCGKVKYAILLLY